jgi:uncharacterized spore protein YtfJ
VADYRLSSGVATTGGQDQARGDHLGQGFGAPSGTSFGVGNGAGRAREPDLFLYKADKSFKFAEVKKGRDHLSESQFACIAQILDVLGCQVDIVSVLAEGKTSVPRTYQFDLSAHTGR